MNTKKLFSERLLQIFEYYSLSSTQFADKIGVQRSTLSHLLSNRNKPSLDFLLKIIEHFPELNLYWLADGSKQMFSQKNETDQNFKTSSNLTEDITQNANDFEIDDVEESSLHATKENVENLVQYEVPQKIMDMSVEQNLEIDYIVIFYKDGSFKRYKEL
ncbi:MAG TPA: helix-turn-helix transcriptional regulator [Flavobacterium sp.]|nr:helix-turn-helix transcriptional regulator [Flavobacterium sp.]